MQPVKKPISSIRRSTTLSARSGHCQNVWSHRCHPSGRSSPRRWRQLATPARWTTLYLLSPTVQPANLRTSELCRRKVVQIRIKGVSLTLSLFQPFFFVHVCLQVHLEFCRFPKLSFALSVELVEVSNGKVFVMLRFSFLCRWKRGFPLRVPEMQGMQQLQRTTPDRHLWYLPLQLPLGLLRSAVVENA